jgi:glucosyl-3-phosphoglycerate synthase
MKSGQVMVVLADMLAEIGQLVQYGINLAGAEGAVHLRALITVPEGQSASEYMTQAQQWRTLLNPFAVAHETIEDDVRVFVDFDPFRSVIEDSDHLGVDVTVVQWAGPHLRTGGISTNDLLSRIPNDLILLSRNGWTVPAGPILLSLKGGPNLSLGIQAAQSISADASITLFHAAENRSDTPDLESVMRVEPAITRTVTAVDQTAKAILRESYQHTNIIMGSRLHTELSKRKLSVLEQLYDLTQLPIGLVRAWQPEPLRFHPPFVIQTIETDVSKKVDRWFAERTFHSEQFSDLQALMALKEKRGQTISLGLPALNEAKTIEQVIRTLKQALMDDYPLLDEIVVIDSNSTDDTVPRAEAMGIPVYKHPDLLPEVGSYTGKGEALWKSLHVLRGDLIVWVDTDISNIHPRFVYGLVGPLLKHPNLQYVKGFYQRPIQMGKKLQAVGGGRVTELVARPLFNLFYPELSGFLQPLAGEYAGRRSALEQVPFFTGYGVETGLLIDLHDRLGLDAMAQVDMEVRVHSNQPLDKLGKMSFAIMQVFIARLESRYGVQLLDLANRSMKLVIQEAERFALEVERISDEERPPMLSVPAYAERKIALAPSFANG